MATEKPRFSITMDSELLSQVEDYQYKNRFKSQSKAIIDLVRAGLGELPEDLDNEKAPLYSSEASLFLHNFFYMNSFTDL